MIKASVPEMTHLHLNSTCPYCGKHNTDVSAVDEIAIPKPGDITMCIGCGGWSLFTSELSIRKPTKAEWDELRDLPEIQQVSQAWHTHRMATHKGN